jgi:hypothetical protein
VIAFDGKKSNLVFSSCDQKIGVCQLGKSTPSTNCRLNMPSAASQTVVTPLAHASLKKCSARLPDPPRPSPDGYSVPGGSPELYDATVTQPARVMRWRAADLQELAGRTRA